MFKRTRKNEADLLSSFLASTCALTIGLNLNWSSDRFADDQLNAANVALYLVAVPWAQWSGTAVRLYGAYAVIVFGAVASVCAGVVSAAFPCSVFGLYAARTLHGSATASLAVAVPNYMADAGKGLYQNAMLCLVEVHIVTGTLISHALNVLVSRTRANVVITGVAFLNVLTLVLIRSTCRRHRCPGTTMVRQSSSGRPDIDDNNCFSFPDEPAPKRRGLLADRERRNGILVCVALFAFRDFGGTRAFTKTVRHTFGELNTGGPVSYDQCALVVTALQLIFAAVSVFAVEVYGKRKLALISSVGTLLSTVALAMIVWNADAADAKLRYAYLTVGLLSYVVFFAQGLGSIPLAVLFDTDHRKQTPLATALVISAHFLCLMVAELSDDKCVYSAVYRYVFVCFVQTIFVDHFVEPEATSSC